MSAARPGAGRRFWERLGRAGAFAVAAASIAALAGCAGPQTAGAGAGTTDPPPDGTPRFATSAPTPTAAERAAAGRLGARLHPQIVERFGGELQNPRATAYVSQVGARLVRSNALQASDRWRFTVLDTGEVNAFATPGGYVYVTRGLLALANSEADVAAVLGHELGHIERRHAERRSQLMRRVAEIRSEEAERARSDGVDFSQIEREFMVQSQALLAQFSQSQELEADIEGIRIAARAGYDPRGQERMLNWMQAQSDIDARVEGKAFAARRMRFLSTHPATPERLRRAQRAAVETGSAARSGPTGRRAHLAAIAGMIIGDDARQGFVRGRDFVHPELGFRFRAPSGFRLANSSVRVTARHADGRLILFDGAPRRGKSLQAFVRDVWHPGLSSAFEQPGPLSTIRRVPHPEFPMVAAAFPVRTERGVSVVRLAALQIGGTVYRFTGVSNAAGAEAMRAELLAMANSFRGLPAAERGRARPDRIRVIEAQRGDSVGSLAQRLPYAEFKAERFRVLNGLGPDGEVRPGMLVKLVARR